MTKKNERPIKPQGKKELNVIFFVDSNRTRSFKLSLRALSLTAATSLLFLTWAGLSPWLIAHLWTQNHLLQEKYLAAVAAIFDYQTRYDGVYDRAYPTDKKKEALPEEDSEEYAMDQNEDDRAADALEHAKMPEEMPHSDAVGLVVEGANGGESAVTLENPSLDRVGDSVVLDISMRNAKSPQRSEGNVWAIMTIKKPSGELLYFTSPAGLEIDKEGRMTASYKKANKYNIRYYKAESFKFKIPKEMSEGWITEVKLGMADKGGKISSFVIRDPKSPINLSGLTKIAANVKESEDDAQD